MIPAQFRSGHILEYKNGHITYPFVQMFVARKWRDMGDEGFDQTEIGARKWFSIDEIKRLPDYTVTASGELNYDYDNIEALERFLQTGEYQILNYDDKII